MKLIESHYEIISQEPGLDGIYKNIEKASTDAYPNYSITQSLYSAKKDGVENYYASYLIDFPSDEVFAWVLVSTTPSYFNSNREYLHNIVCTIQVPK